MFDMQIVGMKLYNDCHGTSQQFEAFPHIPRHGAIYENGIISKYPSRDKPEELTGCHIETSTFIREYFNVRKKQLVDEVVLEITHWLQSGFNTARKVASGSIPESKSPPVQLSRGQGSNQTNAAKKRKYENRESGGSEEDDNGSGQDQRRIKKGVNGEKHQKQKFACPYFKHNPSKYKEWRTCPGPGWLDVHRVKYESISIGDIGNHLIGAGAARNLLREKQLKLRKGTSDMSETEKWRAVYLILFPDVQNEDIPTPFYDYDHVAKIVPSQLDQLAECEDYILREIPLRLQQRLRPELDRDFNTIEESLKRTATYCVRGLLVDAFREFRQIQQCKTIPRAEYEDSGMIYDRFGHTPISQRSISQCCQSASVEQASSVSLDFDLESFDMSLFNNLESSLGEGFIMEEIMEQPGYRE
ncbi:hypothetical protein F4813DRAFT_393268 [Daldinia decipiens]|uniref:uncharacterized protein n=1 Tax=Daldinia decipiens TaxID=326647 RepID=UPI0020C2D0F5|nr:uncharacterized protein F4813DRAFT_393268 [Daldinia decipiens]KAI1653889.1 hypothetical protein F4813DRAFT_393268 [Daldinia decipiens]